MKKAFCVLLSLLLLASCMALAEGEGPKILNPNGYDLFKVTDIFTNDDSELGEGGEDIPHAESLTLQGAFGTVKYPPADATPGHEEDIPELVGFDLEETVCLTLAENCEIWVPLDLLSPIETGKIDDLQAWYDMANEKMTEYFAEGESSFSFYATFEMNDDGELTKIEYCNLEW